MSLDKFLKDKPLYYKNIDYSRIVRAWDSIKKYFKLPKIIHIVGTNGKGSSGRFLAYYLYKCGVKVGHYSSPHILKFNERIWIDNRDIDDDKLEKNHIELLDYLSKEFQDSLSYFEYTTLLAMLSFRDCEYVVLEAGLGGEMDATSVFGSDLTVVTPISFDHEEFLGNSIESIAKSKLKAVRKFAILGKQEYHAVYKVSKMLAREHSLEMFRYDHFFCFDEIVDAKNLINRVKLPEFFVDNLLLAMAAAKFFGFSIEFDKLNNIKLFGRYQKIDKNIIVDVGHNTAAASMLFEQFKGEKIILVYNSYRDKDYIKVLEILKPIIKKVEILSILNGRIEDQEILEESLKSLNIEFDTFSHIDKEERYIVFGSFLVVEEFLKRYYAEDGK